MVRQLGTLGADRLEDDPRTTLMTSLEGLNYIRQIGCLQTYPADYLKALQNSVMT